MRKKRLARTWIFLFAGLLLLIVATFLDNVHIKNIYLQRAANSIERSLHKYENNLRQIMADTAQISGTNLIEDTQPDLLEKLKDKPYYLYIYNNDELIFWSTSDLVIRSVNILPEEGNRVINVDNGYYEIIRQDYPNNVVALGVIPLYRQYEWKNMYLKDGFTFKSTLLTEAKLTLKENLPDSKKIYDNNNRFIFAITHDDTKDPVINVFLLILQIIGISLLFVSATYLFGFFFSRVGNKILVVPFVLLFVILVDIYINQLGVLTFSKYSALFSDTLFASKLYGQSLGQFLLRCFLSLWIMLLINKYIGISSLRSSVGDNKFIKAFVAVLALGWYGIVVAACKSIVINSTINFEFYNFYYLTSFSLVGLIGLAFLLCSLYLLLDICTRYLQNKYYIYWWVAGLVYLLSTITRDGEPNWVAVYLALNFILLATLMHIKWIGRFAIFRSLAIVSVLAAMLSLIIVNNSREKYNIMAADLANELLVERSSLEEIGFVDAVDSMKNDNSIKAFFKSPYINKIDINERLKSKYLKRYVSDYDIEAYLTTPQGRPLAGDMPVEIEELLQQKENLVSTAAQSFYYVKNKEGGYLGLIPFSQDSVSLGTLNIRLTKKIFTSYSAYPVLLQNIKSPSIHQYDKFDFAVYDKSMIVRSKGNILFNHYLDNSRIKNYIEPVNKGSTWQLVQTRQDRTVVLMWKRSRLALVTLFSYTVFLLLIIFFVLEASGASKSTWGRFPFLQEFMHPSLQRNIQSSMILLVLLSLVVVGFASLFFFTYQYSNYYNVRATRQVNGLSKDISYLWRALSDSATDAEFQLALVINMQRLSEVSEVDVNFFNTQGELLATTQPEIFLKGLVAEKINPEAFFLLGNQRKDLWQSDEKIGKLKYSSVYLRVETPTGGLLGFLQCPFYEKQRNLKEDISFFLVSFVNFYILLILIAAVAAVTLSGSITNSLTKIRQHMGTFRIGKKNKPIDWISNDEVGALVAEYNRMINELDNSANLLAQSEREGAWREMAKQVAHEIKNPLTPMKLGIQHLQRAVLEKREDLPQLTERITRSLVEQVDTLAEIASAFSDFARMPHAHNEKINVSNLLTTTVGLFSEQAVDINIDLPVEEVFVIADKGQLQRVFNNLIQNAIQSTQEKGIRGRLDIVLREKAAYWRFTFADNGTGIPQDRHEKIFQPNFTTKSSGTGLGLAICKSILDRIDGKIWLDSIEGEGSRFYIEIPQITEDAETE